MRQSKQTTTLAVLRVKYTDLSQIGMASLCGKSQATIQSIELGRLSLSRVLAATISEQTGVSVGWLLNNDVTAPIISDEGAPYTKEIYRERQKKLRGSKATGSSLVRDNYMTTVYVSQILASVAKAAANGQEISALARLGAFAEKLEKSYEKDLIVEEKFQHMFDRIAECEDVFLMDEYMEAASTYRQLINGTPVSNAQDILLKLRPLLYSLDFLIESSSVTPVNSSEWKEPIPQSRLNAMLKEGVITFREFLRVLIRNTSPQKLKEFKDKYQKPKPHSVMAKMAVP